MCLWLCVFFLAAIPLHADQLIKNLNDLKRQLTLLQQELEGSGLGLEVRNERKLDADDVIDYVLGVLSDSKKDVFKKVLNNAENTEEAIEQLDHRELQVLLHVLFEFLDADKEELKQVLRIARPENEEPPVREEPKIIEEEIPVVIPTPLPVEPVQIVPLIRPLPPTPMQQELPATEQKYEPAPMPPPAGKKEVIAPYQPAPLAPGGDVYGAPPPPPPMGGLKTYRPPLTNEKKQDVETKLGESMTEENLDELGRKAREKMTADQVALANLVQKKLQNIRGAHHVEEEEEEDEFTDLYNEAPTAIIEKTKEEPQGKMLDWEVLQKKFEQQNPAPEDTIQLGDGDVDEDEWGKE